MFYQYLTAKWRSQKEASIGSSFYNNTSGKVDSTTPIGRRVHQVTESKSNPVKYLGKKNIAGGIVLDVGSPFYTERVEVSSSLESSIHTHFNSVGVKFYEFVGPLVPSVMYSSLLKENLNDKTESAARTFTGSQCLPGLPNSDLDGYGTTAISNVAPTSPVFDAATSIAELLREGLPTRPGAQSDVGGEYLNYQFGIAPTISDIKSLWDAWSQAEWILSQLERDSGRVVRRRYNFPEVITTSQKKTMNTYPAFADGRIPSIYVAERGTLDEVTTTKTNIWFSGAFTYYFPKKGWRRELYALDRLYGIQPGIDSAYNLVPMSWLVDYFTNVGDVMSNMNTFGADGLVMPYGYVCASQEVNTWSQWSGQMKNSAGVWEDRTVTASVRRTTKQRQQATPFGFGLSSGSLTTRQKSILAALGYTLTR